MNEIEKVNFHGTEMIVVERDGQKLVAMKPIAEAMGLDWESQRQLIQRDSVLNSTACFTQVVAEDGKIREMLCLPLEYLNGWLFKVPASRYSGKRREAIELYQRECYRVLYDYWHHGAAVNPTATDAQVYALIASLREEMYHRAEAEYHNRMLQAQCLQLADHAIPDDFGSISELTGLPRDVLIRAYARSDRKPHRSQEPEYLQLCLPLFAVRSLPRRP